MKNDRVAECKGRNKSRNRLQGDKTIRRTSRSTLVRNCGFVYLDASPQKLAILPFKLKKNLHLRSMSTSIEWLIYVKRKKTNRQTCRFNT